MRSSAGRAGPAVVLGDVGGVTPAPGVVLPESDVARWMLFAPPPERVDEEEETEFDAVPPTGAFPEAAEASRSALVSAESARSALAAAEPDAVPPGPPFPGTPEACRRAAGSVRRCEGRPGRLGRDER
ncbi:hypothetical protein, partial [Streptomyces ipomoeae]|uniref:hypothetical protein n=1 Tax=Streptomyces ipomoeae TaxID=103232 RepID=UPI0029A9D38E